MLRGAKLGFPENMAMIYLGMKMGNCCLNLICTYKIVLDGWM